MANAKHVHRSSVALLVTLLVPAGALAQRSGPDISTDTLFEALNVRAGQTVCEIGAGSGEMSIAAARAVGTHGRVYSSELGEDRVKSLQSHVATSGVEGVSVIAGDPVRTNFPDGACDAMFMQNVYHHFGDPAAMNASIAAALKPGARLAVIDFAPRGRKEASEPADRDNDGTHGVSADTVRRELKAAGFDTVSSDPGTDRWFMVVVAKPAG